MRVPKRVFLGKSELCRPLAGRKDRIKLDPQQTDWRGVAQNIRKHDGFL
jgi:hypothetical protein